jgi:Putative metallopeptidase
MTWGRTDRAAGLSRAACALLIAVGLGAQPVLAQPFRLPTVPPGSLSPEAQQSFEAKIDELARALANDPHLKRVPPPKRRGLVEFVVGNILFVAAHELGHALLAEMKLPALVGEGQAADDFAVLTALKHGERDFSDRILIEAAKGWFVSGRRGTRDGAAAAYYARHGLDERRGYRIVCLLVGADPARFKALAEETQLPADRRRRCGWDYDRVTRAWERALAPHRRAADQPKARIDVIYGDATGRLAVYAQTFRNLRFLETIADLAADRFAWPAPLVLEMRTCGEANARWTLATRRLHICYELARDFAELYRGFADDRKREAQAKR